MAINYGIELYELVYPKWAKIRLKLSDKGKLLLIINPSLTPGKEPEGYGKGLIPKGTKIFDYSEENECIISLTLAECLSIVDFAKTQLSSDTVDLIHKSGGVSKALQFKWVTDNVGDVKYANVIYNKYTGESNNKSVQNIFVPVTMNGLRELVVVLNSYINNYVNIKTICLGEIIQSPNKKIDRVSTYKIREDIKKADELFDFEE